MCTKFLSRCFQRIVVLTLLLLTLTGTPVKAQEGYPPGQMPPPDHPDSGPYFDDQANAWRVAPGTQSDHAMSQAEMLATGGPDQFGYTWDDSVALSWVDVISGGTLTPLTYNNDMTGAIPLPFNFPFYENSYNHIYISAYGYLTFDYPTSNPHQSRMPLVSPPNNIVAPLWTPLNLANSGTNARVFYKTDGVSYFAVVWNQVNFYDNTPISFQVLLYANGNILFQYRNMPTSSYGWCWQNGIEDSRGVDSLTYRSFCDNSDLNYKAIRFTRPGAAARELVYPRSQGLFVTQSNPAVIPVKVVNTGALGVDTYDLTVSSGWPATLFGANNNRLVDTNGNGLPDTGPLNPGASSTVKVMLDSPEFMQIGSAVSGTLFFSSAINPVVTRGASFSAAVPAPFTQVYVDQADYQLSMLLAQPEGQAVLKHAPVYGSSGNQVSVMETKEKNLAYAWAESRCIGNPCQKSVSEIYYMIRSHTGAVVKPPTQLIDLSSVGAYAYAYDPIVAAAPDGTIGIAWREYVYNNSNQRNYNIWLARLNSAGAVINYHNVSNNNVWGSSTALGNPSFNDLAMATAGNSFIVSWYRYIEYSSGPLEDIFVSAITTGGSVLLAPYQLTADTPSFSDWNYAPYMASTSSGQAMLIYVHYSSGSYSDLYRVFNSSGSDVIPQRSLPFGSYYSSADITRLSDGKILVAIASGSIRYVTLDTSYNQVGSTYYMYPPNGVNYLSTAADQNEHAIFTWQDDGGLNLYYALVDGNGNELTSPMLLLSSSSGISLGYTGGNNTAYTVMPTAPGGIDLSLTAPSIAGGPPGGLATIVMTVRNLSNLTATGVTINATFPGTLTGIESNMPVTWGSGSGTLTLPDMPFMSTQRVVLKLQFPADPVGTTYPFSLVVGAAQADSIAGNNTVSGNVFTALQRYLPLASR